MNANRTQTCAEWLQEEKETLDAVLRASAEAIGNSVREWDNWKQGGTVKRPYWFYQNPKMDSDARVLAVAHIDVVSNINQNKVKYGKLKVQTNSGGYWNKKKKKWIRSGQPEYKKFEGVNSGALDDRLGVYTLLYYLPKMYPDMQYDILLTTDEELGASTASMFERPYDYNWVFEFDRNGTDVVMYEYHNEENEKLLESFGFEVGMGSFTDICELPNPSCSAFNFGVGYYRQHTNSCYMVYEDWQHMVHKFAQFYYAMATTHIEYNPTYTKYAWKQDDWDRLYGAYGYDTYGWYDKGYVAAKPKKKKPQPDDLDIVRGVDYDDCIVCGKRFYHYHDIDYIAHNDGVCEACDNWFDDMKDIDF
jgi:hypothetical protein